MFQKPSFSVVDSALPCVGDNEVLNGKSRKNTGNFLAALQMTANHDDICMGQERLSSLALMHTHYQVKIDLAEVNITHSIKHHLYFTSDLQG